MDMSALTQRCKALFGYMDQLVHRIPSVPRDILTTALLLYAAYWTSGILISHTGGENNSALVFVLAVVCISFFTTGYAYGITASIIGTFCINYFFMVPYSAFSLSHTGYPVAMLSMVAISCIVCALTSRVKQQAIEAVRREKNTKTLYEMNEKLNAEKAAIQLQSARETIRGNILRAVSHDLRTPLTAISGAASVLLSSEDILRSEKNASLANDIKADADALIVMVENLLSVTRIQDGTIPLKKREEMLEEVAGDAILTTRRRFPNCHVDLELSEDILYLPMEPMLIKQVMVNLLENAVRHSGSQSGILLNLFRQDEWAVVEVRDHGKGLPPEVCQAVQSGRPLSRDLNGDSTRGMGIGLSVCQSIIKAHNGFFAAGNAPEGGAVIRFGLPMKESDHE
ncbi:Sensor protein KdpD [uncultured Clostridium sp.]|nr:Sensor protein KdpD [uncultured Clostridium sp.]